MNRMKNGCALSLTDWTSVTSKKILVYFETAFPVFESTFPIHFIPNTLNSDCIKSLQKRVKKCALKNPL